MISIGINLNKRIFKCSQYTYNRLKNLIIEHQLNYHQPHHKYQASKLCVCVINKYKMANILLASKRRIKEQM